MFGVMTIQLIAEDGALYTPLALVDKSLRDFYSGNPILLCIYPEGDCDRIKWPNFNPENLRAALYDARETGVLPHCEEVILPDGKIFRIDA